MNEQVRSPVASAALTLYAAISLWGCSSPPTVTPELRAVEEPVTERALPVDEQSVVDSEGDAPAPRSAEAVAQPTVRPAPEGRSAEQAPGGGPLLQGAVLQLEELRARVLERNQSLAAMRSSWEAALARYPQAVAFDDLRVSYALAPRTARKSDINFGQNINVWQRVPWPGKRRLKGQAALNEAEASRYDLDAMRLRLLEATDEAFVEYYFVARAIEINRVNQELLVELKEIAEVRYGAGLVDQQDALQAEVESQHLVHRGILLDGALVVAMARLNTLLNAPPDTALPPPPAKLSGHAPQLSRAALAAHAVEHRPELSALEHRLRASEAAVALARREYIPDLSIGGGYNRLMQRVERRGVVQVGFDLPVLGGRRAAALAEARASQRRVRAEREALRAEILFEVASAVDGMERSVHVMHLYAESIIPAADQNLEAAKSGYESGSNDFLTLVAAEKALMVARLELEEALSEYHKGRAQLEGAIGGPLAGLEETL